MSRPTMSVTPPAGNGMTTFTGFVGYCSAKAEPETRSAAKSAAMRTIVFTGPLLDRDSPDDQRAGANIRVFSPVLQDRGEPKLSQYPITRRIASAVNGWSERLSL